MTYEFNHPDFQRTQDQLNQEMDLIKIRGLNKAHKDYLQSRKDESGTITTSVRPQNATGLLATDWALDDYTTWK